MSTQINLSEVFMRNIDEIIKNGKDRLGLHEYEFIKTDDIVFSDEVRKACEKNVCGLYGTSWACPPAVGTMEQCRKQCGAYENAIIFTTLTVLEDKYDFDKWREAGARHESVTDFAAEIIKAEFEKVLVLSTEGCSVCPKCTYPNSPCRFPERMHPAAEGYGILVTETAKKCGIQYNNGSDTITFFSLILF
jgi:predicted metal-binding protein